MIIDLFLLLLILFLCFVLYRYRVKKLQVYNSPLLGTIVVWQKYNRERLLTINGFSQGLSIDNLSITKSYWYTIAQSVLKIIKKQKKPRVLILGLGGNTTSLLIQKENPKIAFIIIEIDKYIIQACKDWFSLGDIKNLTLIQDDAYKVIFTVKKIKPPFDAIVIDIFNGKSSRKIQSREEKIITQLAKLITPKGALIFNWPANTEKTKQEANEIIQFCKNNTLIVHKEYIHDPRGYKNFVITALRNY